MSTRRTRAAAPGRSSRGEALEALSVLTLDLPLRSAQDLRLGDQNQIKTRQDLLTAEAFPQDSLGAIACDRPAHLPRGREAQPAVRPAVGRGHQDEERAVEPH